MGLLSCASVKSCMELKVHSASRPATIVQLSSDKACSMIMQTMGRFRRSRISSRMFSHAETFGRADSSDASQCASSFFEKARGVGQCYPTIRLSRNLALLRASVRLYRSAIHIRNQNGRPASGPSIASSPRLKSTKLSGVWSLILKTLNEFERNFSLIFGPAF